MNRRALLCIPVVVVLGLAGCSRSSSAGPAVELKELTVDEVSTRIAAHDGKTFVYDNNPKDRYAQGHLPGAKWVAFDNVTAADLPPDKSASLVFYCANWL
jgi:3-mercaptopyruvate sulfurtransferase SseA